MKLDKAIMMGMAKALKDIDDSYLPEIERRVYDEGVSSAFEFIKDLELEPSQRSYLKKYALETRREKIAQNISRNIAKNPIKEGI